MTKRGKLNLILYLGVIFIFVFGYLFTTVDLWFGLGILASMAICGFVSEKIDKDKWNNGVCAKYNEAWEFDVYGDLSDGDTSFVFVCRDQSHSFGRHIMSQVRKDYKGKTKLRGL